MKSIELALEVKRFRLGARAMYEASKWVELVPVCCVIQLVFSLDPKGNPSETNRIESK